MQREFSLVLTYKLSQDHLEMLFSKIRRFGGWSNNPTAQQFRHAIRKLLMRNEVRTSSCANISDFGDTDATYLDFRRNKRLSDSQTPQLPEPTPIDTRAEEEALSQRLDDMSRPVDFDWRQNVLFYVSGFVARHCAKVELRKLC